MMTNSGDNEVTQLGQMALMIHTLDDQLKAWCVVLAARPGETRPARDLYDAAMEGSWHEHAALSEVGMNERSTLARRFDEQYLITSPTRVAPTAHQ